ncbi:SUF system NifU family Fe-S cluster assembly protein [Demequina sp. B12]|uniref:Fe-S cluster assembly sulfur transfer protein SufU n=1 Tax=Demequina sp. B12 TaxID=2992757 RepID=UPI00237C0403|nr:SUF system NifU family Fe-S cluster assembly protein [Demequina sp. B12]MDE0573234.1 SUF system NifU family Fe-S cluster assembly protein [Demequina sp. B12]
MSSLEQMYQQVIMDHAKQAHGKGLVDLNLIQVGESHQVNTTCGDEIRLRVGLEDDRVESVTWEGQGCSISQASVSVLHELVEGTTLSEAEATMEAFRDLMQAKGEALDDDREDLLGDATAFVGVGKYPARIKCAMLGWMAFKDAMIQARKDEA